jgi:hypothetical protein
MERTSMFPATDAQWTLYRQSDDLDCYRLDAFEVRVMPVHEKSLEVPGTNCIERSLKPVQLVPAL